MRRRQGVVPSFLWADASVKQVSLITVLSRFSHQRIFSHQILVVTTRRIFESTGTHALRTHGRVYGLSYKRWCVAYKGGLLRLRSHPTGSADRTTVPLTPRYSLLYSTVYGLYEHGSYTIVVVAAAGAGALGKPTEARTLAPYMTGLQLT